METGHLIRQAIAATAETSCDGAVAAALVLSGGRSSWTGARLVFAEELEKNLFFFVSSFGLFLCVIIWLCFLAPFHISLVEFVIVGQ